MKKLKLLIVLILILIIAVIISIFVINSNKIDPKNDSIITVNKEEKNNNQELQKVTNPHIYFTVKACVEKYITYLYQNDKESIYKIIDNSYIKEFKIKEENVLNYVENISGPVTFSVEKMHMVEKDENNCEYYVYGQIAEETIDSVISKKELLCVTVELDFENMIYSIIPYGYGGPFYEGK